MDYVLESGYYESLLGYNNSDWYEDELIKLETKMLFCFKNTNRDKIMTQKDTEVFDKSNFCRSREKERICEKV